MSEFFTGVLNILLSVLVGLYGMLFQGENWEFPELPFGTPAYSEHLLLEDIPEYSGTAYVVLQGNQPDFSEEELARFGEEAYSSLDVLGRCGPAFAVVGPETLPTEERGAIGQVKPTGWHLVKYDCVDGKYLYNRCHLIGYQLSGENANEKNLITGTRYLNVVGMLPFENEVADYVEDTGNHVAYRVTPIFRDGELLARGVQMEAWSIEDQGRGVCFNLYAYNVQPGVEIDYATGESWLSEEKEEELTPNGSISDLPLSQVTQSGDSNQTQDELQNETRSYVLNVKSGRFHLPECSGAKSIKQNNRKELNADREELLSMGYIPCGQCNP